MVTILQDEISSESFELLIEPVLILVDVHDQKKRKKELQEFEEWDYDNTETPGNERKLIETHRSTSRFRNQKNSDSCNVSQSESNKIKYYHQRDVIDWVSLSEWEACVEMYKSDVPMDILVGTSTICKRYQNPSLRDPLKFTNRHAHGFTRNSTARRGDWMNTDNVQTS